MITQPSSSAACRPRVRSCRVWQALAYQARPGSWRGGASTLSVGCLLTDPAVLAELRPGCAPGRVPVHRLGPLRPGGRGRPATSGRAAREQWPHAAAGAGERPCQPPRLQARGPLCDPHSSAALRCVRSGQRAVRCGQSGWRDALQAFQLKLLLAPTSHNKATLPCTHTDQQLAPSWIYGMHDSVRHCRQCSACGNWRVATLGFRAAAGHLRRCTAVRSFLARRGPPAAL